MEHGIGNWARAFVAGLAFAAAFAVLLRSFPEDWYLGTGTRVLLFALAAVAGPPTVLIVRWLARTAGQDQTRFLYVANTGAITFDSIATGFAPQVYGHEGPAAHVVLSVIVFGLVSIFLFDQFAPAGEHGASR